MELERAVDVALSQIPTLKSLTLAPQVMPLGNGTGERMNIPLNMFSIFFARTHTKLGIIKIFKIDFVNKIS